MKPPSEMQTGINLRGNYPNPFNPVTTTCHNLPQGEHVIATVYELQCH
ncbi:MAG: hypothetical protein IIA60_12475 [Candidatus Marinimicrobia bacterium]|nr:hypothetical protein [Candidatus Neomarinimicrobiota bacterium]